ncbi:hypothetical protein D8674_028891 [Pyrus ussuriensis x Pyrus communis]|uniref:DUF4283 domain-containing protein n=1 Tax=Pyrus ussuriensis x Pyrus communis TaxID=2448454 RepID=A0A5N5IB16_9ROSA|nr:hypothetical protein D8674_028891 [Pyrus ussuriensis x Pyrus communis]
MLLFGFVNGSKLGPCCNFFPSTKININAQLPFWANPFPFPNLGEAPVVVHNDKCVFIVERGVTMVDTNVVFTANVKYMKRLVLMGKVFGKPESAEVWVKIPQIPMQYKELNILKTITKPIADLVRLDDPCINSLNGMAIKVLMEADVCIPFKQVLVVNMDKDLPTFLSYKGLFKVSFYCGKRTTLKCSCDVNALDASWFLVNLLPEGFMIRT